MVRFKIGEQISDRVSYQIWVMKSLAIFTIFFAHMPPSEITMSISNNFIWLRRIYSFLGMAGVPTFIFLSGFLYKTASIKKRFFSLYIPVFIWGSITFILHCLNHQLSSAVFGGWLRWIIGCNGYLYFVSVIFLIFICYHIYNNSWFWLIVGLISVTLSQFHIIPYNNYFTIYLNPLNFIAYFAMGQLVRSFRIWHFLENIKLYMASILFISLAFFLRQIYPLVWYFNIQSLIVNMMFIILFINITKSIRFSSFIKDYGKCTYVIYLIHMPFATSINKFLSPYFNGCFEFLKVFFAFGLVSVLCLGLYFMLQKFRQYKLISVLGIR